MADGHPVKYLDIGGGLGIDYSRGTDPTPLSTAAELIRAVTSVLPDDVNIIIEPGRSIMANTCGSIDGKMSIRNGTKDFFT